jgi:hypothetical protein
MNLFPQLIESRKNQVKINNKANKPAAKRQLSLTIVGSYHNPYINSAQLSNEGIRYVRLTSCRLDITKRYRGK